MRRAGVSEAEAAMKGESGRLALERAVRALFLASALLDPMRLRMWDREGLTLTQLRLMARVSQEPGLSNADLADRLLVTRPSVSALLDRLERGGYVRREVSSVDRRAIQIWLEPKGEEALSHLRVEARQYARGLMEELDDGQLDGLADALETLIASGQARRAKDLAEDGAG